MKIAKSRLDLLKRGARTVSQRVPAPVYPESATAFEWLWLANLIDDRGFITEAGYRVLNEHESATPRLSK